MQASFPSAGKQLEFNRTVAACNFLVTNCDVQTVSVYILVMLNGKAGQRQRFKSVRISRTFAVLCY